ncbi:hypothetical protein HMPREF9999_02022 [Alloprevotella sp. oral taxon 473 str. F0040]|nr:hypothetical protein HMPREF9999_02022 [Alloprevotella sp. oral taxon 473 str. F0040]
MRRKLRLRWNLQHNVQMKDKRNMKKRADPIVVGSNKIALGRAKEITQR